MRKKQKRNLSIFILIILVIGVVSGGRYSSNKKSKELFTENIGDENKEIPLIKDSKIIIKPIENDIEVIRPSNNNYNITSNEKEITFTGMADPKLPLTINGEDVDLYFTGNFTVIKPLNVGNNSFVISNGEKVITYNINRNFQIIESTIPSEKMVVDSDTEAIIEAKLYSGSKAYAMINGEKVRLKQVETDEEIDAKDTSYARFEGIYKIPNTEEDLNLGKIKFVGEAEGAVQEKVGGELIVNGNKNKINKKIKVKNYSAKLYDIKNISYIPLNNIGSLPKGTIDCATSTIIVDNKKYYNLSSGLRVKEQDLEVIKENNNIENNISKIEITEDEKYVSVKVKESEKASYILKVNGIDYDNKNTSNYGVKNINFDNISIEFNNSILITDKIKFNNNEIFKDAELVKGEKPTLKLSFKNKDGYYGHLANYDDEGNLIIKFRKKVKSIKDLKVVIDPGHGLIENGINDPGALGFNNINEHDINVKIAEQVKNELVEKGATVVILDTSNKFYSLGERPEEAAKMDADLFISIHNNSGGSGEFNANEVYYNKPFSKALALQINKEILSVYKNDLFGGNEDKYNRGTKWDYYTVILEEHCPSVLVEVGYVDNEVSFNKLIDPLYQEKLGKAIASGIEKYININ